MSVCPARSRMARVALAGIACVFLAACERTPEPPPAPPPAVSASARSGPAEITVELDAVDVRTVDRVAVTIIASAVDGAHLTVPEFDPTEAGWTVVSRTDAPILYTDAGPARRARVVLEPFLEGDYEIPPVAVAWSLADGASGEVRSEPLAVSVRSVLTENDSTELAGARPMIQPPAPPNDQPDAAMLALAGGAAVLAITGAAWWLLRRKPGTPPETAADRLARLERDPATDLDALCAATAAALRAGAMRSDTARALIDEADRVRYGRAPTTPERARAMASKALALLAQAPSEGGPA